MSHASPTVLDPFVSLAINEDYKGDPIYKESPRFSSRPTPDSQAYWSNTSSIAKGISNSINSITGGDAVSSGYIDKKEAERMFLGFFEFKTMKFK